jgi:hypothetical protein
MKNKFKAIARFSGLLVCAVMSLLAQNVHAQLRDAWSQTTTTIVYENSTGEIQNVRFEGDSNTPTPVPRGFWRTLGSWATLGYMSSPTSPVHTVCETAPVPVNVGVQADDMSIRLFYRLQRRMQLIADIENLTTQIRNERERQARERQHVMSRAPEALGDIFKELGELSN